MPKNLVIVIEYDCRYDREQALVEAMTQIRDGSKRLNRDNVRVLHVHAAIKGTAKEVLAIFNQKEQHMDLQLRARTLITEHVNARLEKTDDVILLIEDVYIVWFVKTLQNWKALVSTNLPDGMYYELTYNGDKMETYIDAYKKFENVRVRDI